MNDGVSAAMLETILAFSRCRIAVLGDVMLDRYVTGEARRISPEAPIPVMKILHERTMPGGAGNVARNIATLGGQSTLVGVVGADEEGAVLGAAVANERGLAAQLIRDPLRHTTVKQRFIAQGQQLLRVDRDVTTPVDGAIADAVVASIAEALENAPTVVLSDYAKGVLSTQVIGRVMALARDRGSLVVVDPKRIDMSVYAGATVITPNASEASLATGVDCNDDEGVVEAGRRIADIVGCRHVVVTRGVKGMTVVSAQDGAAPLHLRTVLREVHDVSGAGDTAVATLALALTAGAPIELAARLANIAAGIAVSKSGTVAVSVDELNAEMQHSGDRAERYKLVSAAEAAGQAARWREQGKTVVFTNGCFDLLHPGHVRLLRRAKAEGDRLIVALNSDASVRRNKGDGRPIQSEAARAMVMASIEPVDLTVIFDEDTPLELIATIRPDVLVKGADYSEEQVVGGSLVQSGGGRVVLVPLEAGHSTSAAIDRAVRSSSGARDSVGPK